MWLLVHIYFLSGFKNRMFVLVQWGWSYLTFARGSRLIESREWRSYTDPVHSTDADDDLGVAMPGIHASAASTAPSHTSPPLAPPLAGSPTARDADEDPRHRRQPSPTTSLA